MKKTVYLFVFLTGYCTMQAQVYKTAPNGSRYFEKNGLYIFPGKQHFADTIVPGVKQPVNQTKNPFNNTSNAYLPEQTFETNAVDATIVLNITTTRPTCGYGSGSIIVEAANGVLPYTYFLTDEFNYTQQQNTGNFPVVGAGTYTVKVRDANGDSTVTSVTLTNINPGPVQLGFTGFPVRPTGCTTNDGSIVLNATGGTPPYTYSLDLVNFQTSNVFNNLYPGLYSFYVKDNNGCLGSYHALGLLSSQNGSCTDNGLYGGGGGFACIDDSNPFIEMIGTNGPYQYSMDGVNYQPSGQFFNVGVGVHKFYIKKANGEVIIWAFNLARFCEVYIEFVAVAASCLANNGTLEVTASRGTPPYLYTIDGINYQASNIFTNLSPGNYFVTVKDNNGIKSSIAATVFDRCPIVQTVTTSETCIGNDGTITAGGFRGTEPYQFSIDGVNFQSSPTFTGLAAGTYPVTIKDALAFTGNNTAVVRYSCLQVSVAKVDATCGNNNGSITVTATNGAIPYQYSINGVNFQTSNVFNNLPPGPYTVTVKDNDGKTATKDTAIVAISSPVLVIDTLAASCSGNDGRVSLSVSGGVAPFQYSFNGTVYNSVSVLTNVRADSLITAYVKDKNDCISPRSFMISSHCPLITLAARPEVCNLKDGFITATVSTQYAPYAYSLNGVNYQTGNVFTGLAAGNYRVYVKDASGIVNSSTITVGNSCTTASAIVTDETCGYSNGSVLINASNGTAPYRYSIDNINFQTANLFSGLAQGPYKITVRDALQTDFILNVQLINIPGPGLQATATAVSCANNNGKIELAATAGKPPYSYSLDGITFVAGNTFSNLAKGYYKVYVRDANGCATVKETAIPLISDLNLSVTQGLTVCEGNSVQLSATSNGTQLSWTPSATLSNAAILNPIAKPIVTTKYYIEASRGICNKTDSTEVKVNPAPVAIATGDTTLCFGQSVNISGSGGAFYQWSPSTYLDHFGNQSPVVKNPSTTIQYKLKVTDHLGCASLNNVFVTVTVKPPSKLFAGNDTSAAKGELLQLSAKDMNNTGFIYFDWRPATGLNNSFVQNPTTVLSSTITYFVTAATPEGCKAADTVKVAVFEKPEIFVPTAFTPNGDGLNDILKAIPVGIKQFHYFKVFNRWGELFFSTDNYDIGWSGVFKNMEQLPGTYSWFTAGTDFKGNLIKKTGIVLLIR